MYKYEKGGTKSAGAWQPQILISIVALKSMTQDGQLLIQKIILIFITICTYLHLKYIIKYLIHMRSDYYPTSTNN